MKYLKITFLFLLSLSFNFSVNAAVKIVECVDIDGNRSYQSKCPPGFTQVGEKKVNTRTGTVENKVQTSTTSIKSATLYTIPECDSCDEVREFLNSNGVSVNEIDVSKDYEVQTKFEALAGDLRVPVTVIDGNLYRGYNRAELKSALEGESSSESDEEEAEASEN